MRINVYSQELTNEVNTVCKVSETGRKYFGVRLMLHSSPNLHHTPDDDDRSAVVFWLPGLARSILFAETLEKMAEAVRKAAIEQERGKSSSACVAAGAVANRARG